VSALAGAERWLLRVGLFILPLAYAWNMYDQFVLPKLLVARLLLLGLLVLFIARTLRSGVLVWKRTALDLPLAAFLGSAALSTIFATNLNVGIFGTYSRYDGLLTLLTYAGLFWLSTQVITSTAEARILLRTLIASGYAVAVTAVVQSAHDSVQYTFVTAAFGALGNANVLGAFLAMVLALAIDELIEARTLTGRIIVANVIGVIGLALLLTLSRSAWLAAILSTIVLLAGRRGEPSRWIPIVVGGGLAIVVVLIAARTFSSGVELERVVAARAATVVDASTWNSSRTHIWQDSLNVIAARPVLGYGPDNFGLVYPQFESGDWGAGLHGLRQQVDKAHAEVLQVAATQGIVGAAAYLFLLMAFVRAFWQGRRNPGAIGLFAGWVAYQVTVQLNFTALASAFPFWIFAAAAMVTWGAVSPARAIEIRARRLAAAVGVASAAGLVALAAVLVAAPYYADVRERAAVDADLRGQVENARLLAAEARRFGPRESVYAVEVANIAFQRSDWSAARDAYQEAAALGTYNALVYRNLALADGNLGLRAEGLAAARKAVELDRFDVANQAVLAEFEQFVTNLPAHAI
jgi:O-antigen ligase